MSAKFRIKGTNNKTGVRVDTVIQADSFEEASSKAISWNIKIESIVAEQEEISNEREDIPLEVSQPDQTVSQSVPPGHLNLA